MALPVWATYEGLHAPECVTCCTPVPPDCFCGLIGPYPYPLVGIYANLADAETVIEDFTADCLAWTFDFPVYGKPTPSVFTANNNTPNVVVLDIVTASNGVSAFLSIAIKEGVSISTVFTVTTDGIDPLDGVFAVFLQKCDTFESQAQEFAPAGDLTGTLVLSNLPAGNYFLQLQWDTAGGSNVSLAATVTADDTMIVNPVLAAWDDSGTTRLLDACPRLVIPVLTEFTGEWYTDQVAAQAALDDQVSNCVGYTADLFSTFDAFDGGANYQMQATTGASQPTFTAWASLNLEEGQNLEAAYSIVASAGTVTAEISIYDHSGVLVQTVTGASPLISSALPYTGRYIIKMVASSDDVGAALTTIDFFMNSVGTVSVNPVQVLYDVGVDCPARLACV